MATIPRWHRRLFQLLARSSRCDEHQQLVTPPETALLLNLNIGYAWF